LGDLDSNKTDIAPRPPRAIHPFLIALIPSLFLYSNNVDQISPGDLVLPIGISITVAVIAYLGIYALMRDGVKAGLMATLVVLVLLFFGTLFSAVESFQIAGLELWRLDVTLVLIAVLLIYAGFRLRRSEKVFRKTTMFLNFSSLGMVGISLVVVGQYALASTPASGALNSEQLEALVSQEPYLPDVYHIILDAYNSEENLKEFYDHDNSEFVSELEKRGFVVPGDAHSNYGLTYLSVASTLNSRYLDEFAALQPEGSKDYRMAKDLIIGNQATKSFKAQGYQVIMFNSGWSPTSNWPIADQAIKSGIGTETLDQLLEGSLAGQFMKSSALDDYRNRITGAFKGIQRVASEEPGPKYVFAHVISPHPPFVFKADGSRPDGDVKVNIADKSRWDKEYASEYVDQLTHMNTLVLETVDRILREADKLPIIIVQGDHGSASSIDGTPPGWRDELMKERMGILNAVLLPEKDRDLLVDGITPVNTYRIIRDQYLGEEIGMTDDVVNWSYYARPWEWEDVTEILEAGD